MVEVGELRDPIRTLYIVFKAPNAVAHRPNPKPYISVKGGEVDEGAGGLERHG